MLVAVSSEVDDSTELDDVAPVSLNDLLGQVAEGDQAAFGQLYDQ